MTDNELKDTFSHLQATLESFKSLEAEIAVNNRVFPEGHNNILESAGSAQVRAQVLLDALLDGLAERRVIPSRKEKNSSATK